MRFPSITFNRSMIVCVLALAVCSGARGQCHLVKLIPPDLPAPTGTANPAFGFSIDIDGDTMVIGAEKGSVAEFRSGAAYIFERDVNQPTQWVFTKKIGASDGRGGDAFGSSVAIDGDTVVVGARFDQDPTGYVGSAYVFMRDHGGADNWGEVRKIEDPGPSNLSRFGNSVCISGEWLVVGAPGKHSAFIFRRDQGGANNWGYVDTLQATEQFGTSCAIDGDVMIVGAVEDNTGTDPGYANVYRRSGSNWTFDETLPGVHGEAYGTAVAIEDHGSFIRAGVTASESAAGGSFSVFETNLAGFQLVMTQSAGDTAAGDMFGAALDLDGDNLAIGATMHDHLTTNAGAGYLHQRDSGGADHWGDVREALPYSGTVASGSLEMGRAVAIDGDTLAISSHRETAPNGAAFVGAVYVLSTTAEDCDANGFCDVVEIADDPTLDLNNNGKLDECECLADLTHDDVVDVFDLFAMLNNWGTSGAGADLAAPASVVDVFDLFALLGDWGPCP